MGMRPPFFGLVFFSLNLGGGLEAKLGHIIHISRPKIHTSRRILGLVLALLVRISAILGLILRILGFIFAVLRLVLAA